MTEPARSHVPPRRRRFVWLTLMGVVLYLLVCLGCCRWQRRMIYFPPVFSAEKADEMGAADRLERWRDAAGRPIGWKRLAAAQPAQGQVLITHGNAGAAVECGHYADVIQAVSNFNVFVVEYPGYADLPGTPTERTLDDAAANAFRLLAANGPVHLVGESLGTGVAAYLAGKFPDQTAGIVLLAPYNRLADVAQAHMIILPVHLLLCDRFPAQDDLRHYHGPVAIWVAGKDRVVPAKFGRRLYDSYRGPKKLWEFSGGDHGTVMLQPPELWSEVFAFWGEHTTAPR